MLTDPSISPSAGAALRGANWRIFGKLTVVTALMFAFGYALVPIYKTICTALGINVLSLSELDVQGGKKASLAANTQVDLSRTITIEFDANARGPWEFKPEKRSVDVHPGEITTVMVRLRSTCEFASGALEVPTAARSDSESTLMPSAPQIAR